MKKVLLFAVVLSLAFHGMAAVVDVATAQSIAKQFLTNRTTCISSKATEPSLQWTHRETCKTDASLTAFYVVNTDRGFVVLSGDDRARDILAWGEESLADMNNLPEGMKYWLNLYKSQMEYLFEHPGIEISTPKLASRATESVNPLLTANWSQNAPYWNECPAYGTDTCYTGCPATSLSMVFHYWKYPRHQTPAVPSYLSPTYGVVLEELPPTVFDWNNMLDDYTGSYNDTQAAAVAHLMRYIGQTEEMDYTISGSGAYGKDVLRAVKFFEYDQEAQLLFKTDDLGQTNYTDAQWEALIQTELYAARPIVYLAYDNYTGAGHAFNVDGYDAATGNFHVNWGWNGRGNGFFALNAFSYGEYTFGTGQQMVIGIQPPEDYQHPRLQVYPTVVDLQSYINRTATATISLKGTNLTHGVTLTLNDADGVFSLDAVNVSQALAEAGIDITVTYSPRVVGENTATIVCTSEDTDPVTVLLNGTAPLEVYPVEMQPANNNWVTLTSFRACWTDATPAGNITGYTLKVNPKPAYTLLVEADFSDLPEMSPSNQASHATDYLPDGWTFTGSEFNLEGGCVMPRRNSVITTNTLDFKGYDKVTVEVLGRSYGSWGDESELTISSSRGSETITFPFSYATRTVVLDCAETDQISFKCGYYPMIQDIRIYAGDATQAVTLLATEEGDTNYRLVEGITAKSYTVSGLTASGTFLYKVKANYIDGSESEWSNVEMVTLAEGGRAYEIGDVNHDGRVSVGDVASLINYLLSGVDICTICGDVNADGAINVKDISDLISQLLLH